MIAFFSNSRILGKFFLAVAPLFLAFPACAELGGDVTTIQADQVRMKGAMRTTSGDAYTVHEIQTPAGTVVREYVSPGGTIYAVAWEGPWMPDLKQLLGPYFDQYTQAARQKARRGPLRIQLPGLVVETSGHPRSFFGRAYIPASVPQNVDVQSIR